MTISYTDFELDILKYEFTIRSGNRTVAALSLQLVQALRGAFVSKYSLPEFI